MGKRVFALTDLEGYAEYAISSTNGLIEIQDQVPNGHALALATQYCTAHISYRKKSSL